MRSAANSVRAFTAIPAILFLVEVPIILLDIIGIEMMEPLKDFLIGTIYGIVLTSFLFVTMLLNIGSWILVIHRRQRLNALRYRISHYLSTSFRRSRIDLEQIARDLRADPRDLIMTMEFMVSKGEIRGRIDTRSGNTFNGSLTRKGRLLRNFLTPSERKRIDSIVKEK